MSDEIKNGDAREKLIAVIGPTAVGKTALSMELARIYDTEIISGDSMLVYRGFDIGTAKPTADERARVHHELIDILAPEEHFSVSDFQKRAGALIKSANERGKIPILAGGTGLYVKALLEGYELNEQPGDEAYRMSLEALAREHGKAYVHDMLAKVDATTAARLHVNDFRRVVRALEVYHLGQEKISTSRESDGVSSPLIYDAFVIGLRRDRVLLYERIERRVDMMMAAGLEREVRRLMRAGVRRDAPAMRGIGYREMAAYIDGEMTLDEAVSEIKKSTRHFAKRQFTWYRKMPYIHWYDVDGVDLQLLLARVTNDLRAAFP
ncbi:MAG: tRNA (adenosine(37)-N6)-dimethylallyltransferase MiaA [Selenomonadaceae bacterium]